MSSYVGILQEIVRQYCKKALHSNDKEELKELLIETFEGAEFLTSTVDDSDESASDDEDDSGRMCCCSRDVADCVTGTICATLIWGPAFYVMFIL